LVIEGPVEGAADNAPRRDDEGSATGEREHRCYAKCRLAGTYRHHASGASATLPEVVRKGAKGLGLTLPKSRLIQLRSDGVEVTHYHSGS
jgi:hypothetical protein